MRAVPAGRGPAIRALRISQTRHESFTGLMIFIVRPRVWSNIGEVPVTTADRGSTNGICQ